MGDIKPFYEEVKDSEGKTQISINNVKLIEFWESLGYRKVIIKNGSYKLVKITRESIVDDAQDHLLRDEVKGYLTTLNRIDILEVFLARDYVTKKLYEMLETIEIKRNTGCKHSSFLYFKNVALEITKDNITYIDYEQLEGFIWKNEIIPKEIKIVPFEESEFKKFIEIIADNNPDRNNSLITIIGYLLHTYKDSAYTKAIVIMDTEIDIDDDDANGGTGKTLIGKALNAIVPTLFIDGKTIKTNDKFRFSGLESYHRIIIFDDVKKDFDFESLYPLITGELQIEKKYKNAENIVFEDSPKILISSNYVVKGSGGNAEKRRKIEFEVSDYFKNIKTPQEEFGRRLFDDWDDPDWQMFYSFMINALQTYLIYGLIEPQSINVNLNRLRIETTTSFVSFMDNVIDNFEIYGKLDGNALILDKGHLLEEYLKLNHDMKWKMTAINFKKYIDKYCAYNDIYAHHYKSNSSVLVKLIRKLIQ